MKLILVYFSLTVFAISSAKYVSASKTEKYKIENGILYDANTMSEEKIHEYSVSEWKRQIFWLWVLLSLNNILQYFWNE